MFFSCTHRFVFFGLLMISAVTANFWKDRSHHNNVDYEDDDLFAATDEFPQPRSRFGFRGNGDNDDDASSVSSTDDESSVSSSDVQKDPEDEYMSARDEESEAYDFDDSATAFNPSKNRGELDEFEESEMSFKDLDDNDYFDSVSAFKERNSDKYEPQNSFSNNRYPNAYDSETLFENLEDSDEFSRPTFERSNDFDTEFKDDYDDENFDSFPAYTEPKLNKYGSQTSFSNKHKPNTYDSEELFENFEDSDTFSRPTFERSNDFVKSNQYDSAPYNDYSLNDEDEDELSYKTRPYKGQYDSY